MGVRLLESIHGHVAILAIALLLHPVVLLWRGRGLSRGGRWAVALSGLAVAIAFALGVWIYGPYRELVRRDLFDASERAGWLFETKEHLAYVALALALGATALALLAPPRAAHLRRAAARLYLAAFVTAAITGAIGTWVASLAGF